MWLAPPSLTQLVMLSFVLFCTMAFISSVMVPMCITTPALWHVSGGGLLFLRDTYHEHPKHGCAVLPLDTTETSKASRLVCFLDP